MPLSLPTDPCHPTSLPYTLLPPAIHVLRILLLLRVSRRRRLALSWATTAALILADTTRAALPALPAPSLDHDYRIPVPPYSALLAAAVLPVPLLLIDEAIAHFARRRRSGAHPLAPWAEAVLSPALGVDALFICQGIFRARHFGAAPPELQRARKASYTRPIGAEEMERAKQTFWFLDRKWLPALAVAGWAQLLAWSLPGFVVAHEMFGVEPHIKNVPVVGAFVVEQLRWEGFVVEAEDTRDGGKIGLVELALSLCFGVCWYGGRNWWSGRVVF